MKVDEGAKQGERLSERLRIAEAAHVLGVSVSTLRNWDKAGKLSPRRHPLNGYRMYDRSTVLRLKREIEGIK